jgi:hypothetical protein
MDRLTPERRSYLMRQVRGKDTAPEMVVRRIAHAAGFRFRLHRRDLLGKPDLVFPIAGRSYSSTGVFGMATDAGWIGGTIGYIPNKSFLRSYVLSRASTGGGFHFSMA